MVSGIHCLRNVGEIVTEQPDDITLAMSHLNISSAVSIRGGSAPSHIQPEDISPGAVSEPRALSVYQTIRPRASNGSGVPLSAVQINENIATIICKNISPHARSPVGWIYALRRPQFPLAGPEYVSPIKIGHTGKDEVHDRLQAIAHRCKFEPDLLFAYAVPNSLKYESLVHATLHRDRRWEASGCTGCNKKHVEWFDVNVERARRVVRMWALFAVLDPYDEEGALKETWRRRLENVDHKDPWCWETFVYGEYIDRIISDAYLHRTEKGQSPLPGILEG